MLRRAFDVPSILLQTCSKLALYENNLKKNSKCYFRHVQDVAMRDRAFAKILPILNVLELSSAPKGT
jgi:hypothetical protein